MRENVVTKAYFGLTVRAFTVKNGCNIYPWNFEVVDAGGKIHNFAGIPNRCENLRSALKRAWWRARWLQQGTFNERYR